MEKNNPLVKLAATAAALSIAVSALFSLPTDDDMALVKENQPQIIELEQEPDSEEVRKLDDDKKASVSKNARQQIFSLIRTILVFIASVLMKVLSIIAAPILRIAGKPLGIIFSIITDALIIFFIFMVLFGIIWKLLYPGRSLKELYTKKNVLLMAIASVILSIIGNLSDILPQYRLIISIAFALSYVSIILFLYYRIIDRFGAVISRKRLHITITMTLLSFAIRYLIKESHFMSVFVPIISAFMIVIAIFIFKRKKDQSYA